MTLAARSNLTYQIWLPTGKAIEAEPTLGQGQWARLGQLHASHRTSLLTVPGASRTQRLHISSLASLVCICVLLATEL